MSGRSAKTKEAASPEAASAGSNLGPGRFDPNSKGFPTSSLGRSAGPDNWEIPQYAGGTERFYTLETGWVGIAQEVSFLPLDQL
jgi:hypothetical protein